VAVYFRPDRGDHRVLAREPLEQDLYARARRLASLEEDEAMLVGNDHGAIVEP
jgi:hypothetical protein